MARKQLGLDLALCLATASLIGVSGLKWYHTKPDAPSTITPPGRVCSLENAVHGLASILHAESERSDTQAARAGSQKEGLAMPCFPSARPAPVYPDPFTTDYEFQADSPTMLLARMIFGEKAIDSNEARTAAGLTALNRQRRANARRAAHDEEVTLRDVLLAENQYSCFNGDRATLMNPVREADGSVNEWNERVWRECYDLACVLQRGEQPDFTSESTCFIDVIIGSGAEDTWMLTDGNEQPYWARSLERQSQIQSGPGRQMWTYRE